MITDDPGTPGNGKWKINPDAVFFGFLQRAFEAGLCGKSRINPTITTRSANDAV
jgi:hypothetical protein